MTFHLGDPDIKALLFLELEKQMTLPPGRTCPEGAVEVQYYRTFPPHTPSALLLQTVGSLSSARDAAITGMRQGPLLPGLGGAHLCEDRLGRKTGCE